MTHRGFEFDRPRVNVYYYLILYNETGNTFKVVASNRSSRNADAWTEILRHHLRDTGSSGGTYLVYNTSTKEGVLLEAIRNDYDIRPKVVSS